MKNCRLIIGYVFIALAVSSLLYTEYQKQPDGKLHAYFLDVGQGDATLLVSPSGKQVLIDGGPNLDTLEYLGEHMPFFDRTIELLVLTHPDADHLTALPEILQRYNVQQVLISGVQGLSGRYQAFLDEVAQQQIPVMLADPEKDIDLGDGIILDVIWPPTGLLGKEVANKNDTSVVIRVLGGEQSILLTGDIEKDAEAAILSMQTDIRSDILKAAHHGSKTSSTQAFLEAVDPDTVIISAGRDNRFGHPHLSVLERFEELGYVIRHTANEGVIAVELALE
ncbi:MAG: MBL fold metallo-hydrolase [bacterium]|nr:MBL fold metallo-hydrolase [bacterium]